MHAMNFVFIDVAESESNVPYSYTSHIQSIERILKFFRFFPFNIHKSESFTNFPTSHCCSSQKWRKKKFCGKAFDFLCNKNKLNETCSILIIIKKFIWTKLYCNRHNSQDAVNIFFFHIFSRTLFMCCFGNVIIIW